jgi:small neutral amino acid transporter SnatA (MarC family)
MRIAFKIGLIVIFALIALAIIVPLLHLALAVLVVAAGVILVMAAWKVLFGGTSAVRPGGPPAISS